MKSFLICKRGVSLDWTHVTIQNMELNKTSTSGNAVDSCLVIKTEPIMIVLLLSDVIFYCISSTNKYFVFVRLFQSYSWLTLSFTTQSLKVPGECDGDVSSYVQRFRKWCTT
jgi:hypothetical protein